MRLVVTINKDSDSATLTQEWSDSTASKPAVKVKSWACPDCGEDKAIRHRLYSPRHECKNCGRSYTADCSRHRHGGSL